MHKEIYLKPRTDLSINSNDVESLCIEIHLKKYKNILFSVMYRPPKADMTVLVISIYNILGYESNKKFQHFLISMFQYIMIPAINTNSPNNKHSYSYILRYYKHCNKWHSTQVRNNEN